MYTVHWVNEMDLTALVKRVRTAHGETQQQFATRLGISIRALANYEKDRNPTGRALTRLTEEAHRAGLREEAEQFNKVLLKEIGVGMATGHFALTDDEQVIGIALVALLRNQALPDVRKHCGRALGEIWAGCRALEKAATDGMLVVKPDQPTSMEDVQAAIQRHVDVVGTQVKGQGRK